MHRLATRKLTFFFLHQVQPSAHGTVRRRFAAGSEEPVGRCSEGPRSLEMDQGAGGTGGGVGGTVAATPRGGAAGVTVGWSAIANKRTATTGDSHAGPELCSSKQRLLVRVSKSKNRSVTPAVRQEQADQQLCCVSQSVPPGQNTQKERIQCKTGSKSPAERRTRQKDRERGEQPKGSRRNGC